MTPNEQAMWNSVSEAIEPYCVDGAQYIRDYCEHEEFDGFTITGGMGEPRSLKITVYLKEPMWKYFPIEDDLRIYQLQKQAEGKGYYDHKTLNWVDAPGTFEGLPDEADA